jgi:peptidoglycan-associated lipoprotein
MANWVAAHPACQIGVEGYTDKVGTSDYNWKLGGHRATGAYNQLIADGVSPHQLQELSAGKSHPAGDNDAENRRVILQILGPSSGK